MDASCHALDVSINNINTSIRDISTRIHNLRTSLDASNATMTEIIHWKTNRALIPNKFYLMHQSNHIRKQWSIKCNYNIIGTA